MMIFIALFLSLAVNTLAGPVPASVDYRNLTLLDGTIKTIELPAGITFVSTANTTAESSSSVHEKRLDWHPGSENDECDDSQFYTDKTTGGSPNVVDCKWIADVESLPDNQVSKANPKVAKRLKERCLSVRWKLSKSVCSGLLPGTCRLGLSRQR